jgi:hypothetical protein
MFAIVDKPLQLIKRHPFHHFDRRKPFGSNVLHNGNVGFFGEPERMAQKKPASAEAGRNLYVGD